MDNRDEILETPGFALWLVKILTDQVSETELHTLLHLFLTGVTPSQAKMLVAMHIAMGEK